MLPTLIPVFLAIALTLISYYAPLTFPPPYNYTSVAQNPSYNEPSVLEGPLEINGILQSARRLYKGQITNPETIRFDRHGNMYIFAENGIFKASPTADGFGELERAVEANDRFTISGDFDSEGSLYFCDVQHGLMRVTNGTSKSEVLLDGEKIKFCDCLVVSSDDVVYIADASHIKPASANQTLLASRIATASGYHTGRLLKFTPSTGNLEVLVDDLAFANGVEISHDESHLLATEGGLMHRVRRHWLKGPKAGTTDIFIPRLPGHGDNINRASDRTYWMAIFLRINSVLNFSSKSRLGRYISSLVPEWIILKIQKKHTLVIQVDANGNFLRSFHDTDSDGFISTAVEHKGKLYIGGFVDSVKVIDLDAHQGKV